MVACSPSLGAGGWALRRVSEASFSLARRAGVPIGRGHEAHAHQRGLFRYSLARVIETDCSPRKDKLFIRRLRRVR